MQFGLTTIRSFTWNTFILEILCSNSGSIPLWGGSRCCTTIYAIPLFLGTVPRKCSSASSPPADAPIPTNGNNPISESEATFFVDNVDLILPGFNYIFILNIFYVQLGT